MKRLLTVVVGLVVAGLGCHYEGDGDDWRADDDGGTDPSGGSPTSGGSSSSGQSSGGDPCSVNGAPKCTLVFGNEACDSCAHASSCCSKIGNCADQQGCCGLTGCSGDFCGGTSDLAECLKQNCSQYGNHTQFLGLATCITDNCSQECQ